MEYTSARSSSDFLRSFLRGICVMCGRSCKSQARCRRASGATLQAPGSGSTTLYLFGPGGASKRTVQRGSIELSGDELKVAGRYTAIVDGSSASFFVTAAPLERSPSSPILRACLPPPAARCWVRPFSSTAFRILCSRQLRSAFGWPWRDVGRRAQRDRQEWSGLGAVEFRTPQRPGAVHRFLRRGSMRGVWCSRLRPIPVRHSHERLACSPTATFWWRPRPFKDCSGNAVPDGTIVTFTSADAAGRSTVDARIKRGFARAELPRSSSATLSVAAGVVLGNEIHWGGGQ